MFRWPQLYRQSCSEGSPLSDKLLGIILLHQDFPSARGTFSDAVARCREMLNQPASPSDAHYALATALVGQAVCGLRWAEESERAELLAPALAEYRRALEIAAAPGIVHDALRDLELIRAAGVGGLKPAFDLLESVLV